MPEVINCQKLACPQPLLQVRSYIQEHSPERFAVIVDNPAACENVTRFAQRQGYAVTRRQSEGLWRLEIMRVGETAMPVHQGMASEAPCQVEEVERILVIVASEIYGNSEPILGERLLTNFLTTLPEMGDSLWRVVLLNGAVKLAIKGSPSLGALQAIEACGVDVLVCATCLDYFGMLGQHLVGDTTNMLDIVTSMQVADKVLQI